MRATVRHPDDSSSFWAQEKLLFLLLSVSFFYFPLESSHLIVRAYCATMTSKDGNSKRRMELGLTTAVMRERIIVYQPTDGCTSGVTLTKSKESQRES